MDNPGVAVPVYNGRSRYLYSAQDGWLYNQLPSGRVLCYSAARVNDMMAIEVERNGERRSFNYERWARDKFLASLQDGTNIIHWDTERASRSISFMGRDSKTKKWSKKGLYGGLQCENIVQATARDILLEAMFRVDAAGYPMVMTVHDEIVAETRDSPNFSEAHFKRLMEMKESWYSDMPIAVAAWEDVRYVK